MAVNTDYDTAWEDIQLVIQEVEKKALKAQSRTDILFYTYGTLEQGKHVVHMGINSTEGLSKAREGANTSEWDGDMLELMGMFDGKEPDPDKPWSGSAADVAGKYLRECFGCSFRMAFDYQLNPLSLIEPLLDAARNISDAVKRIEDALDPFQNLQELCAFMEQLKIFCPQDLATLLMSLKMLLLSYALRAFNLKLDWTAILGPILKAIAELLIAIVDAILNLVLAPIDCALGALRAAEQVERAGRQLGAAAVGFGQGIGRGYGASAQYLEREVRTTPAPKKPFQRNQYGLGSFEGRTLPAQASDKPAYGAGFHIRAGQALDEAFREPEWAQSTIIQKAVVSVSTARQHLVQLFDNLKLTLDSLSQLVSGGLAFSLELGGLLLMLFDLIGMIMMVIRMFKNVGSPKEINWCEYLAENPEVLREQLRRSLGRQDVQMVHKTFTPGGVGGEELATEETVSYSIVVNGKVLGDIPLCVSSRDTQTKAFMDHWIQELERGS